MHCNDQIMVRYLSDLQFAWCWLKAHSVSNRLPRHISIQFLAGKAHISTARKPKWYKLSYDASVHIKNIHSAIIHTDLWTTTSIVFNIKQVFPYVLKLQLLYHCLYKSRGCIIM